MVTNAIPPQDVTQVPNLLNNIVVQQMCRP